MSSTTSTGGQSPRRSATAPDPPSPRRSGNNVAPAAATDVVLSALSSSPPSNSNSITSMSSGSSSSHRSSSPVGNAAERSPQPSRNNVFRQYFRGRQRRPADSPALPAAGNNSNGFSSPAPGSPVVGGGGGGGGSPVKASPPSNGTGANTGAGGGAWHQRLAAWRKNKRDSLGSNNLKAKPSSSANAGSGETFAVSDADAGDSALDPNRRTTIWCVGDLVVNVSIGRKSTIPELRDCLAASAKSADFELPPSFVLAVERDRSIVLLSELFSPATLPFEMDTQFLVDGVEFRYLVLPEKFELFEADAVD